LAITLDVIAVGGATTSWSGTTVDSLSFLHSIALSRTGYDYSCLRNLN